MEFFDVIKARRSCRFYTPDPVPEDVIKKAIDAALLAPNSSNMQTWGFYWVRSMEKKKALMKACFNQPAASTAQELIVCVASWDVWNRNRKLIIEDLQKNPKVPKSAYTYYEKLIPFMYRYGFFDLFGYFKKFSIFITGFFRNVPRGPSTRSELFEMMIKSAALACENLMLAVYAQGYACCPMEGFDECRVKKIVGLNRHSRVVMIISVGKPQEKGIIPTQFRIPRDLTVFEI